MAYLEYIKHRGEGNSTLVLSINEQYVLRIKKRKPNETECVHKDYEVMFLEKIIKNFIKVEFCPTIYNLTSSDKEILKQILKKYSNLCFGCLTIMPDYTYLHKRGVKITYSVEIKPKQGWIPKIDRYFGCIFCKMQFMKTMTGKISKKSAYCPLDLFSGNKYRMYKALTNLLQSPQNNLKILRNNQFVFNKQSTLNNLIDFVQDLFPSSQCVQTNLYKFCSILFTALNQNFTEKVIKINNNNFEPVFVNETIGKKCMYFHQTKLTKNCVLYEIFKNQQLLNKNLDYNITKLNEFDYVNNIDLSQTRSDNLETIFENQINDIKSKKNIDNHFHNYLIASVFNDCSILITFEKKCNIDDQNEILSNDQFIVEFDSENRFIFCVKIIDLGPKSKNCLNHHVKRLEGFHEIFLQYLN